MKPCRQNGRDEKFKKSSSGAATVEFAIIASLLVLSLIGTIEFARITWTRQALAEVASESVRCAAIRSASCDTSVELISYMLGLGRDRGVVLSEQMIVATSNISCNGYQAHQIKINYPTHSSLGPLIPMVPEMLSVSSCYPVLG